MFGLPSHLAQHASPRVSDRLVHRVNQVKIAIEILGGKPSELAQELTILTGRRVTKQMVQNWKQRGQFSRWVIPYVVRLTGQRYDDLIGPQPTPKYDQE